MSHDIKLGYEVEDSISGFRGIVTTIGYHVSGCTRFGVRPVGEGPSDRRGEEEFFYEAQLEINDKETDYVSAGEESMAEVDFELGERVQDTITGIEGYVAVINYELWNCPKIGYQSSSDNESNFEWSDAPRLESVNEGFAGEFNSIQESTIEAESGCTVDAPSENLSGPSY